MAEYVWLDAHQTPRSKTMTMTNLPRNVKDLRNGASEKIRSARAPIGGDGELQTSVYPSNLAPIGAKLWQRAFQTICKFRFFFVEFVFWNFFRFFFVFRRQKIEICKSSETRVAEVSRRSERSSRGKRTFEVRRRRRRVRKSFRAAAVIKPEKTNPIFFPIFFFSTSKNRNLQIV